MKNRGLFSILLALFVVAEQIEYVCRCKELIYKILEENDITIPFPQRDVHIFGESGEKR